MDNYAAHKRVEIRDWLAANPRVHVHFTPTGASWMNLVEVWFGIIERQAIHRGSYRSVRTSTPRSAPSSTAGTTEPPLRLDQDRRASPRQSRPSNNFKVTPLGIRRNGQLNFDETRDNPNPAVFTDSAHAHRRRISTL